MYKAREIYKHCKTYLYILSKIFQCLGSLQKIVSVAINNVPTFFTWGLFSREQAKSEFDWVVMSSVFVASQSSYFFLCSHKQIRLVENRFKWFSYDTKLSTYHYFQIQEKISYSGLRCWTNTLERRKGSFHYSYIA